MNGILLVDKPKGWTSFDVVHYVRKIIATAEGKRPKSVKVGHTGTLDPLATGLLVLLLGDYTKRASELVKLDKTYEVTMKLGATSATGDEEGEKTIISNDKPTQTEIERALQKFRGVILQTPPAYSAIKVNGQRAYKLARAGQSVENEPREVRIYSLRLATYDYPFIAFVADVSSGTYIRTLVGDMGRSLGTGAYVSALRRTKVGRYDLQNSVKALDLSMTVIRQAALT